MLGELFPRGAFAGATPAAPSSVVTDEHAEHAACVDQGRFIVELRVAPSLPMTFLTVRLVQSGDRGLADGGALSRWPIPPTRLVTQPVHRLQFLRRDHVPGVSKQVCSAAFSECDGLEMTMEVKTIREGGNNGRQIRLTGPVSLRPLTLKRG